MRARDVMTAPVISVGEDVSVAEVARMLLRHGISAMPVIGADGRLAGIVSEGDLVRRVETGTERVPSWWLKLIGDSDDQARDYTKSHGRRVSEVMTRDVETVGEDTALGQIADLLERRRIKRVPVVHDGKLVGIVSRANLLQAFASLASDAPAAVASDETLKARIENELRRSGVDTALINVVVADGVANLWGAVRSEAQLDAARVAAETAAGRSDAVRSRLSVLPASVQRVMWAE